MHSHFIGKCNSWKQEGGEKGGEAEKERVKYRGARDQTGPALSKCRQLFGLMGCFQQGLLGLGPENAGRKKGEEFVCPYNHQLLSPSGSCWLHRASGPTHYQVVPSGIS